MKIEIYMKVTVTFIVNQCKYNEEWEKRERKRKKERNIEKMKFDYVQQQI